MADAYSRYTYTYTVNVHVHIHIAHMYIQSPAPHVIIGVIHTADFRESHCAPDAGIYISGIVGLAQIVALT